MTKPIYLLTIDAEKRTATISQCSLSMLNTLKETASPEIIKNASQNPNNMFMISEEKFISKNKELLKHKKATIISKWNHEFYIKALNAYCTENKMKIEVANSKSSDYFHIEIAPEYIISVRISDHDKKNKDDKCTINLRYDSDIVSTYKNIRQFVYKKINNYIESRKRKAYYEKFKIL